MSDPTTRTVLVPTLIETIEQAVSLPVGARIKREPVDESDEGGVGYVQPFAQGIRVLVVTQHGEEYVTAYQIVHERWYHLVPVEATVERMAAYAVMPDWDPDRPEGRIATRLTTPWTPEETP